jgi:clan AA aspartic protease (TIGR02281 family)
MATARFVFDTGAAMTTITHELAEVLGYSARDGFQRSRVRTAIGNEDGYKLRIAELSVLGTEMPHFPVNVFDLGYEDVDGLLGMNFLNEYNCEIRPGEQRILIERVES